MDNAPPQDPRDLRIAQLEAALAATQAALDEALVRIAELERRLNLSSKNSSKPPSSDSPASRAARRTKKSTGQAQGGQKGHDGHHRSLLDESKVDHFIEHRPAICAGCGLELDDSCPDGPPLREQTFELPALAPVVTEHRLLACRCRGCGHVTRAASPIKPGATRYGPNLLGLIGYLNVCLQASRRQTLDFLESYIGVPTSLGTIQHSLQALIPALAPLEEQARAASMRAAVVGCDETGWYHKGKGGWVWCVQSEQAAHYFISPKRDAASCQLILGELGERVVVSDRYTSYQWIPDEQRQVCLAHIKRDFEGLGEHKGVLGERAKELAKLCGQICAGHSDVVAGKQTLSEYQDWVKADVRPAWQKLISQVVCSGSRAKGTGTAHWCNAHEELVFRFASGEVVIAPHNNASERAVRMPVLKRKVSFGTQSEAGKRVLELLWCVRQTCKLVGASMSRVCAQAVAAFQAGLPAPSLV